MYDLPIQKPPVCIVSQIPVGHPLLGAVIRIPPPKPANQSYKDLTCSEEDRNVIIELITTIRDNETWMLPFKQNFLHSLGAKIEHLHPLKFLAVVCTTPKLKGYMREIFNNSWKRDGFFSEGFGADLSHEQEKNNLYQYLPDFANELNLPVDAIRLYCQLSDWPGLVQYLIDS